MRKMLFIALLFFVCDDVCAQTINATYKAMSYDELVAPLRDYQNAYDRAEAQINEYLYRAMEANENEQWQLEKYYFEKILQKNTQFRGNIIDHESVALIKERIAQLEAIIKREKY